MAKILIVDDEARIREMIKKYAIYDGHTCDEADSGEMAIDLALNKDYDIIIMDVMMGEVDGFTACKTIKNKKDVPIIMLTALNEEYDKVHGFELGIDDYVVKPFSTKELMMRINAILKRCNKANNTVFEYKGLKIDYNARVVSVDGNRLKLSYKEYELLIYLIKNENIALTREQILANVWNYDFYGDSRTIDSHIKKVRHKLGKKGKYIKTIRGVGYKFEIKK